MNKIIRYTVFLFILLVVEIFFGRCTSKTLPFEDKTHFSQVFGKEKTYRLYLPDSYENSGKQYPVIYFFHGWGGRYFKDDSAKLEYEKLGELVNKYQVILVMWDGNIDEAESRPYNIGSHKDVKFNIQMKDYFPELISHIDSTYHTLKDRNNRGIIGFSMGGFMSFYLAGKYPDKVSAAVNMVGSQDFFVGLPENHTLYQMRYMFDNLRDVGLLFHNRTNCPMSGLNDEVDYGAQWSEMPTYEYRKMEGNHQVDEPGETKVFESAMQFVVNRFENPVRRQQKWSHSDLCPNFELWGYSVKSEKNEPGFICLKDVDSSGFGFYTHKWMPEGPALKNFKTSIFTAPVYEPNAEYSISIFSLNENKTDQLTRTSDNEGRIHIELKGEDCEVGISKKNIQAGFTAFGYQLSHPGKFLKTNQQEELSIRIFNRGGVIGNNQRIKLKLSCADSSLQILSPEQEILVPLNSSAFNSKPIQVLCSKTPPADGSPESLRMHVDLKMDSLHFTDVVILRLRYDVPEFTNIQVDDGRFVAPTLVQGDYNKSAIDSVYGVGNADGAVSCGEQIMLYEKEHRLRLYSNDPFVVATQERLVDEFLPGQWPDGMTLSSVVKIADNCPAGHEIEFLAHYETKTFMPMYRNVQWGKVKIRVNPKP
jgi:hypothetical protein